MSFEENIKKLKRKKRKMWKKKQCCGSASA
jgi:hypothetical protein